MMCSRCSEKAVWKHPLLCKEHYVQHFEEKVNTTIQEYKLIPDQAKICVAVSGGKDSLTVLNILHDLGYNVSALLIDEGIAHYREHTIIDAQQFCKDRNIPLVIKSFKELTGQELDTMLENNSTLRACTVCGTFRRHLLNKHATGFDVLATGHNADDEAQVILMNLLRAQTNSLARPGPTTTNTPGLVRRIKPLYFCTEKEIMTYAFLKGFAGNFTECPNVRTSYRAKVRDILNHYTQAHPHAKNNILKHYLALQSKMRLEQQTLQTCIRCGATSNDTTCSSCKTLVMITMK